MNAFGQILIAVNGQMLKTQSGDLVTLELGKKSQTEQRNGETATDRQKRRERKRQWVKPIDVHTLSKVS